MRLIALIVLAVACIGLAWVSLWLLHRQRRLEAMLTQEVESDAGQEKRLKELAKRIESYQQANIRMGEELRELSMQLTSLPDRVTRLEQHDPTSLSFSQAARLIDLGASITDLTQTCGLSQAEAELVARLHEAKSK